MLSAYPKIDISIIQTFIDLTNTNNMTNIQKNSCDNIVMYYCMFLSYFMYVFMFCFNKCSCVNQIIYLGCINQLLLSVC